MLEVMPGSMPEAMPESQTSVKRPKFNSGTETLEIRPGQFSMKESSGAEVTTFGQRQAYNA